MCGSLYLFSTVMEDCHSRYLNKVCRFCAGLLGKRAAKDKKLFQIGFLSLNIDVEKDIESIHPKYVCSRCKKLLERLEKSGGRSTSRRTPYVWSAHTENCKCVRSAGRPKKELSHGSDKEPNECTESGDEDSESDTERKRILTFKEIMASVGLLDSGLAWLVVKEVSALHGIICIQPKNMKESISCIDRGVLLKIVESIFESETEFIKKDVASCNLAYKSMNTIKQFEPLSWIDSKNSIVKIAIKAMSDPTVAPIKQALACDQLYQLACPQFISPLSFTSNLLLYTIARSKMAANMYGRLHPSGGYHTVQKFLKDLTLKVPEVPNGDILLAVDNDQVLVRKWTVRKENRAQLSILTSVCVCEIDTNGELQRDANVLPR